MTAYTDEGIAARGRNRHDVCWPIYDSLKKTLSNTDALGIPFRIGSTIRSEGVLMPTGRPVRIASPVDAEALRAAYNYSTWKKDPARSLTTRIHMQVLYESLLDLAVRRP